MANPHKGEVDITIGGKKHSMRLPISAMVELEEDIGIGVPMLMLNLETMRFKLGEVIPILYYALGKKVDQPVIMEWIDEKGVAEAVKKVSKLLKAALEGKGKAPGKGKA